MQMNIYIVYYFVQYMGEKTQTSMILQSSEDDFKADKGCTFYKSATEHAPIIHMANLLYKYYFWAGEQ